MKRVSMIVSKEYVNEARQLAVLLKFTDDPENIFIAELSSDGNYPVSHYGLSTAWSDAGANLLAPTEYDEENDTEIILPPDVEGLLDLYNLTSEMKEPIELLLSRISIRVNELSIDAIMQFDKNAKSVGVTRIVVEE
jgi:hypothetical protein